MEKGFYPEELPPCFEVSGFFDATKKLGLFQKTKIKKGKKTKKEEENRKEGLELSQYNASKRGFQRRIFSCPNPLFYIRVALFLGNSRKEISDYLIEKGSHYSCSIPQIDQLGHRAITINAFSSFDEQKRVRLATYPYLVKLDISRFYHSIYTHAIPWAYYGKDDAKSSSRNRLMDKLDKIVSFAQRNQTIGIPIGPDTSRIVSEIIAVAVDEEFRKIIRNVHGVRLVDDAVFGAKSESHAQKILNAYREALREFELDINETKTKIIPSSKDLESYWTFSIKRDFERGIKLTKMELTSVLDHVIRITNERNDDGIIKFAIRKIDKQHLWIKHWDIIEPFLMRVSVNFSHCLSYVVSIVICAIGFKKVNTDKWEKVCHLIIEKHAPLGHDSEVTWACWLLKNLPKPRITKPLLRIILKKGGTFPALIAVDIADRESAAMQQESKKLVMDRLTEHPMREKDWLLSYESERLFGYPLSTHNTEDYPFFGDFISHGVQFYNPGRARKTSIEDDWEEIPLAIKGSGSFYEGDDSEEDGSLEGEFTKFLLKLANITKDKTGYNPTRFRHSIWENGGLETAQYLINKSEPSEGYTRLWEEKRLDLTMEAQILEAEGGRWKQLFTEEELEKCRKRLRDYKYNLTEK